MELAADKGESIGGCLRVRNINFGVRFAVEAVVFDAATNPNDRDPVATVSNPFADWVFITPMAAREHFVDDGDAGRGLVVVFGEIAALFDLVRTTLERRALRKALILALTDRVPEG